MATTTSPGGQSFRQVRNVSGFTRPMSVWDAFIYNFLTMGVIFPWTYLWAPASFPGASLELGILLTLLAQIPISLAYCSLSSVLPVTGGDYVYQRYAFGRWGFVAVMSGFVIWILQWVALSGWLFTTLGLSPLLLHLGVHYNAPALTRAGVAVQSPLGVVTISIALALFTTLFLIRGLRLYVRIQKWLFAFTILAVGATLFALNLPSSEFATRFDTFFAVLAQQLSLPLPADAISHFFSYLQKDVAASGVPLTSSFSFLATLGVIPIAWTSLQWATYSVEQNTEIAEADSFKKQLIMLVGSAVAVGLCLILIAVFERRATTSGFMTAASAAYWLQKASPETVTTVKTVLQPFPNILAIAVARSPLLVFVIALGFLANAFQITCNCFIGVTRILVAMGTDGLLPRRWALERVDPTRHAPVRAHWAYFAASIPAILAYSLISTWSTYTLGVTFACGYVFTLSALAAAFIPTKMASLWKTSDVSHFPGGFFRTVGWLGFLCGAAMVVSYVVVPELGLTGDVPYFIVIGVIVISYGIYVLAKARSPLVDKALESTPDDIKEFYT